MATQVQFRRGTTSQHSSFTGAVGEVTVDTDLSTLKVHDGSAAGGVRIAKFTDIASSITAATIDISDSSSNTVSLVPGASDITFIGDDITIAAAGNTMTFTLNNTITVDQISSGNSTGITLNDDLLLAGTLRAEDSGAISVDGTMQISGVVTAAGFTIGSAVIGEAELEILDGATLTTTELNYVDGVTSAIQTQLDARLPLAGGTMTGDLILGDNVKIEVGSASGGDLQIFHDGSNSNIQNDTGELVLRSGTYKFQNQGNSETLIRADENDGVDLYFDNSKKFETTTNGATVTGSLTATGSFVIGSADINETDLEKLDGITNGTAAANKALVADANIDIGTIRNLSMTGNMDVGGDLQLDGNLTVSGTTNSVNTTTLEVADALLELNKNNSGGADIDGGILIQRGSAGNNAVFYWNEGDDKFKAVLSNSAGTATAVTDSSQATIVASIEGTTVTGTTVVGGTTSIAAATITNSTGAISFGNENLTTTGTINGGVITGTGFTIGSAAMNEVDLEKLDGITNGTIAANKAVVVDANKDASSFRNLQWSGTGTGDVTGALTGNASTATVLATSRDFAISGDVTAAAIGFTGSGNVALSANSVIASTVKTQSRATDAAHFLTFVTDNNGSATAESVFTDAGIQYNPSSNILSTTATAAQYSDLAEKYVADAQYEPGTVVIFGGDHEVTTTEVSHDPRVAGVISTAPGFIMNESCEGTHVVELALTGRVPCKVKGVVAKGDMIVSSNVAGVGTKLNSTSYQVGCIIGKALESKDTAEEGVIEVVVGRL